MTSKSNQGVMVRPIAGFVCAVAISHILGWPRRSKRTKANALLLALPP